jgi:protein TonB
MKRNRKREVMKMIRYAALLFLLTTTLSADVSDLLEGEQPPVPIGGYEALAANIEYPDMAYKAGMEGKILVKVWINEDGQVTSTEVLEGSSKTGMVEAACEGLKRTRFEPARQHGRPMATSILIPIVFDL